MMFIAIKIITYFVVAYAVHPCAWDKKEGWRKKQLKKTYLTVKKVWGWKKDVIQFVQNTLSMSIPKWDLKAMIFANSNQPIQENSRSEDDI